MGTKPFSYSSIFSYCSKLFQSCKIGIVWNSQEYNAPITCLYFSPLIYPFFCLFRDISDNKD